MQVASVVEKNIYQIQFKNLKKQEPVSSWALKEKPQWIFL